MILFWKEEFKLEIETFSKNHIDTTINKNSADEWQFTGFLWRTGHTKRLEAWDILQSLKNRGLAPWICAGDFNEITKQPEIKGGQIRPHHQMQPFRDVLDECGFMDIGF